MTVTQIDAGVLLASETEDRIVSGLLVPYGEECSKLGRFTVEPGVFKMPTDYTGMSLNIEHERKHVVGGYVSTFEKPEGLYASFKLADTPEGDAALADIKSGKRKHLSVEADVMIQAGKAIAGRVFAAALCAVPAFPSATLLASAEDTPEEEDEPTTREEAVKRAIAAWDAAHPRTTSEAPADEEEEEPTTNESETTVSDAVVPETLQASAPVAPKGLSKSEVFTLLAAKENKSIDDADLARLNDMNSSSATLFASQTIVPFDGANAPQPYDPSAQFIGEIWDGVSAGPVIADLLGQKTLTRLTVSGFKFTTEPTSGDWAGNGAEIPSGPLGTTPVTYTAKRWASGLQLPREWRDFGVDAPLLDFYYTHTAAQFVDWLDAQALAGITTNSDKIVADNPAGLSIGAGASMLIDGAMQVLANTGVAPTFAIIPASIQKEMLKHAEGDVIATLSQSLGLTGGEFAGFQLKTVADDVLPDNDVLVGTRQGGDIYTLPGVPIRAEGYDVAHGLDQVGLYGYGLYVPAKADAFVSVAKFSA